VLYRFCTGFPVQRFSGAWLFTCTLVLEKNGAPENRPALKANTYSSRGEWGEAAGKPDPQGKDAPSRYKTGGTQTTHWREPL